MPKDNYNFGTNENQVQSLRLPAGLKKQIMEDMEIMGDYSNLTAWLQGAARAFLASRKEERERLGGGGPLTDCLMPGYSALA